MRLESRSWHSRGPAAWPWPVAFDLSALALSPVSSLRDHSSTGCPSPGCPLHSAAAAQGCWGPPVYPIAPHNMLQKHEARDVQTGFQQCPAPASYGTPSFHQRGSGLGNSTAPELAPLSLVSPPNAALSRHPEAERCIPAATRAARRPAGLMWLQRRDKDRQCGCVTGQGQSPVSVSHLDSNPLRHSRSLGAQLPAPPGAARR